MNDEAREYGIWQSGTSPNSVGWMVDGQRRLYCFRTRGAAIVQLRAFPRIIECECTVREIGPDGKPKEEA